jgi:hypothetical protein
MKNCPSHKKIYFSKELAEDALIEAHARFEYGKGRGPIAVYQCGDCGYYHFTSQGVINEKLATYLSSSKAKLDKQASQWEEKFKKR